MLQMTKSKADFVSLKRLRLDCVLHHVEVRRSLISLRGKGVIVWGGVAEEAMISCFVFALGIPHLFPQSLPTAPVC